MNFFDTWDPVARASTPQTPQTNDNEGQERPAEPSLEEEVNQVIGQLGRFWGGFRTQSQKVLETARKDLGDVVVQAQKELEKLAAPVEPQASGEVSTSREPGGLDTDTPDKLVSETTEGSSTDNAKSGSDPAEPTTPTASTSTAGTLFARLQSAIPPNLVATIQSRIPESIKHASENVDLAQIRTNLMSEFQRVQGITRAQAEEYAHKGEAYLREVVKEANEALQDAVKIIPPEEGEHRGEGGMIWDGTDMWMLPTELGTAGPGDAAAGSSKQGETQTAVASRALALLTRLQTDPTIIKHDPDAEEAVKDQYRQWVAENVESKGGIDGAEWSKESESLLKENTALYEMFTSLVPSELTKEEFWLRYFFRANQIKVEEERRKALVQATTESDEDFSWEGSDDEEEGDAEEEEEDEETSDEDDEDDDSSTSSESAAPAKVPTEVKKTPLPIDTEASRVSAESARPISSGEDSYDMLSSTNASVVGDAKVKKPATGEDESSDSDWE